MTKFINYSMIDNLISICYSLINLIYCIIDIKGEQTKLGITNF